MSDFAFFINQEDQQKQKEQQLPSVRQSHQQFRDYAKNHDAMRNLHAQERSLQNEMTAASPSFSAKRFRVMQSPRNGLSSTPVKATHRSSKRKRNELQEDDEVDLDRILLKGIESNDIDIVVDALEPGMGEVSSKYFSEPINDRAFNVIATTFKKRSNSHVPMDQDKLIFEQLVYFIRFLTHSS